MPPTIGGRSMPYESGQSGAGRPEPGEGTIAPAKMRNRVSAAVTFVKCRSQAGVGRTEIIRGFYTSTSTQRRGLGLQPLDELIVRVDGQLSAHAVVAVAAQLRAGHLPRRAVVRLDRREVNRDVHARNRVLLHAHDREGEAVDDVLRGDVADDRPVQLDVELIDNHHVVFRGGIVRIETDGIGRGDELRIAMAEDAVRAGIVKVPRELL